MYVQVFSWYLKDFKGGIFCPCIFNVENVDHLSEAIAFTENIHYWTAVLKLWHVRSASIELKSFRGAEYWYCTSTPAGAKLIIGQIVRRGWLILRRGNRNGLNHHLLRGWWWSIVYCKYKMRLTLSLTLILTLSPSCNYRKSSSRQEMMRDLEPYTNLVFTSCFGTLFYNDPQKHWEWIGNKLCRLLAALSAPTTSPKVGQEWVSVLSVFPPPRVSPGRTVQPAGRSSFSPPAVCACVCLSACVCT